MDPDNNHIETPIITKDDALKAAQEISRGGIWADDKDISLSWAGEDTSSIPVPAAPIIQPKSATATAEAVLRTLGIDEDSERAIARIVKHQIIKELGFPHGDFKHALQSIMAEQDTKVKKWLEDSFATRFDTLRQMKSDEIKEIQGRLATVQAQLEDVQKSLSTQTEAQSKIVEEAMELVRTGRQERGETESDSSVLQRLKEAATGLEAKAEALQTAKIRETPSPQIPQRRIGRKFY
jgi:hypothetical protein